MVMNLSQRDTQYIVYIYIYILRSHNRYSYHYHIIQLRPYSRNHARCIPMPFIVDKLSKSRRFQPYTVPQYTNRHTSRMHDRWCRKGERGLVIETKEGHASFVSSLISIGCYYWLYFYLLVPGYRYITTIICSSPLILWMLC
jgi:hypothetical protein